MQHLRDIIIPSSETHSLPVNLTSGCKGGKCTFCEMKEKNYCVNSSNHVIAQIDEAIELNGTYRRAYLMHEDAISLPNSYILEVIDYLKEKNPFIKRISITAKTSAIIDKGLEQLVELKNYGINRIYQNIISGSNEILKDLDVTVNNEEQLKAANLVKESGIELAQTIALGTASCDDLQMNAFITAKHLSNMAPDYINAVELSHEVHTRFNENFSNNSYDIKKDIINEMITIIENLESPKTIFSSFSDNNDLCLYIHFPEQKDYILSVLNNLKSTEINNSNLIMAGI